MAKYFAKIKKDIKPPIMPSLSKPKVVVKKSKPKPAIASISLNVDQDLKSKVSAASGAKKA